MMMIDQIHDLGLVEFGAGATVVTLLLMLACSGNWRRKRMERSKIRVVLFLFGSILVVGAGYFANIHFNVF